MNQDTSTLGWVRKELEATLQQAGQALEDYAEDSSDRTRLRFCATYLHQVYGTLQMLELYGLSRLVQEMERVLEGLINGDLAQTGDAEETLMRGILSVADYLERVQRGQRDSAALVLPLLNDLRVLRGACPLTQGVLLAPDLGARPGAPRHERPGAGSIAGVARQHRPAYQRALLAYLRGESMERSLERMQTVLEQLEAASGDDGSGELWWVAAGLVDGLRLEELETTPAVKSLLGQVDRHLRQVIDHGGSALVEEPSRALFKNMLDHIEQLGVCTGRLGEIQRRFSLGGDLGDTPQAANAENIGGYQPGSDILQSVADALGEDLTTIKDALDLYVRGNQSEPDRLSGMDDMLKRIADTLGMLGLAVPRCVIREQVPLVERLAEGQAGVEQELMDFARALLYVESALDGLVDRGGAPEVIEASDKDMGGDPVVLQDRDFVELDYRGVYLTAIREAVSDFGAIKAALVAVTEGRGEAQPADLEPLLRRLQGVLEMLDLVRAGGLLNAAGRCIREEIIEAGELPPEDRLDSLADAITSLEYYLEAVLENRSGRERILDVAEESVRVLGYASATLSDDTSMASGEVEPVAVAAGLATGTEGAVAAATVAPDWDEWSAGEAVTEAPTPGPLPDAAAEPAQRIVPPPAAGTDIAASPAPAEWTGSSGGVDFDVAVTAAELDPEILEIFLEEVYECVESIRESCPRWRADTEQPDALMTLRRTFHTLKGSGRLAGTLLLGELAWSVERLLNRIIDGYVTSGPQVFSLIDHVQDAVLQLVKELQSGQAPTADVRALMREAVRLADGDPEPESLAAFAADDSTREPAKAQGAAEAVEVEAESAPGLATPVDALPTEVPIPAPGPAEAEFVGEQGGDEGGVEAGRACEQDTAFAGTQGMDAALYDIFRNEAASHLRVVRDFIAAGDGHVDVPICEDFLRALHTLSGSARMANVQSVATLARDLELHATTRCGEGRGLDGHERRLMAQGAELLEQMVVSLGQGDTPPDSSELRRELASLAASSATAEEARVLAATGPEPRPEASWADGDESPQDDVDQDLVALFLEEAGDILAFLDDTLTRWEDDPEHEGSLSELQRSLHTLKGGARLARFDAIAGLCHAVESLVNDLEGGRVAGDDEFFTVLRDAFDELVRLTNAAREPGEGDDAQAIIGRIDRLRGASGCHDGEPTAPEDEGERELMDLFLEEASEILQGIESVQHAWMETPDDRGLVQDLERALHTLKGGARMAGYRPMANLSHALESLLVRFRDGQHVADARLFDLLDRSHDRLHWLREQAASGIPLGEATDLLTQLEQMQPAGEEDRADRAVTVADTGAVGTPVIEPAQRPVQSKDDGNRTAREEQIRVRADLLDSLVSYAGEVSIYRARLERQVGAFRFNLGELNQTVERLREQLRTLEIETEARIPYRYDRELAGDVASAAAGGQDQEEGFDPLELDRFTRMQELSRRLGESVNDLSSIESLLDQLSRESETLLLQQSRVNTELQDGLMRTRMVPFASLVPRLRRIVRQTAGELGRKAEIRVQGAQGEMDRSVLDRVVAPLEHMLRNAVAHGIESPEERQAAGKPEAGQITLTLDREGAEVVLWVADDGAGMNLEAIRRKAHERGLLREAGELTDREVMQFVLEQGFSTAREVTQVAGRGVGMDVVNAEIKQLGGTLEIESERGKGTRFIVRLPFTLAMNQALLCATGEQTYAIPLTSISGVVRVPRDQMRTYLSQGEEAKYHYLGHDYQVTALSLMLGDGEPSLAGHDDHVPLVLLHSGDYRLAMHVDELIGSREIVVKSVGPQISTVPGIYGATILADGRVVLILEMSALMRQGAVAGLADDALEDVGTESLPALDVAAEPLVMVVDDSITMRKVAARLLERNHMEVVTASDGVDAVAKLQDTVPDAMLLDIEMPRMDGYELVMHMRNDARLRDVPIVMITSRTGEKHRQRALNLGVDRYLGKPYQESDLLGNLEELLTTRHGGH